MLKNATNYRCQFNKMFLSGAEISKEKTMKKIVITLFSLSFLFSLSSCDDMGRKCVGPKRCGGNDELQPSDQDERYERKW